MYLSEISKWFMASSFDKWCHRHFIRTGDNVGDNNNNDPEEGTTLSVFHFKY